ERLLDVTRENVKVCREVDLPILRFFAHMPEGELELLFQNALKSFMQAIVDDKVLEQTTETMMRWKLDQIEGIPKNQVELSDMILSNSSRKRVLLKFLPHYTTDVQEVIQIATELEMLYTEIEHIHFNTYKEIHDKYAATVNANLREFQEELQVTNEELQESYEEVQVINEELREQIEIRKEIEEELEKEKKFLSMVLENVNDGIVVCDENGDLKFFNQATRGLHGIKEEALPPEEWAKHYNLYDADGKKLLKKEDVPLFKAYKGKEVKDMEMVIRSNDGSMKSVIVNGGRIWGTDGSIQGALVVMNDITERKSIAEKQAKMVTDEAIAREVKRQKEALENFFNNAPVPISIAKGPQFTFTLVNKAYQKNFFPNRDILNKNLLDAIPELKGNPIVQILDNVYKTGERYVGNEVPVEFIREKGEMETGYFNFIYEPSYSPDGEIDGVMALAYEITELILSRRKFQELSDELAANNEELMAANEEIQTSLEDLSHVNQQLSIVNADMDNFIYTASHDLKAPIANIEGLVKVLAKQLSPDSKAHVGQILEFINSSIERFKNTLLNLTQVVKIQKEEHLVESVNLLNIIEEIKMDLQLIISQSKATVENHNCEDIYVDFSQKNFKSVIYNLISNAIKYASPNRLPEVNIYCKKEGEYIIITVQDNGLGMDLNHESKIFNMFKRLHNHVEGTGIGLYIVKKIIENNGGKIEVSSKLNEGSTFTVYLKQRASVN
nr:ATP-binding protein [Bacteroidota bacterium]